MPLDASGFKNSLSRFNRWRLLLISFLIAFAILLLFNLDAMSIQWDEVVHCYGGLLLLRGNILEFMRTNTFYPPVFDLVTAGYFAVGGASILTAKLVGVTFSLLSIWLVFEAASYMFGVKTAFLTVIFLAVTPGFVWLSRMALIETMLLFFFVLSMFFFFKWVRTNRSRDLIISGLAVGLGFLVKYQMLAAGIVMLVSLLFLGKDKLKSRLRSFPVLILVVAALAIAWFTIAYIVYSPKMLTEWLYALQFGNQEKSLYSARFPLPIFYILESTLPYPDIHPISILLFILGIAGLCLFAWRRKTEDKFLIVWFLVVYIFFTLISNRQWRYVFPIYPVLAVSAACLVSFAYAKAKKLQLNRLSSASRKNLARLAAVLIVALTVAAVLSSCADSYYWVSKDQVYVPVKEATGYIASKLGSNESVMVVCGFNRFSNDMVGFYLLLDNKLNSVFQYPGLPVDIYTPDFQVDHLVSLCQNNSVKYVLLYEYGSTYTYFNTTLTAHEVAEELFQSGRFTFETSFGLNPRRVFVVTFA